MACTGHTNSCPTHPGYDPPLAGVSWTDPTIGTDDEVKATHFNEMTYYTNFEFTRRGESPSGGFPPSNKTSSDIVYAVDYRNIRDHLKYLNRAWDNAYIGYGVITDLQPIQDETTEAFRDEIDTLRAECLCDCNYSCTCNCNYCVCNCNYACTCNCNYSDKKLKREIKYL